MRVITRCGLELEPQTLITPDPYPYHVMVPVLKTTARAITRCLLYTCSACSICGSTCSVLKVSTLANYPAL